jgi:hypothetical protein
MAAPGLPRSPLTAARRRVRRHRRPIAAVLAAAAVVTGLTALRTPAPVPSASGSPDPSTSNPTALRPGESTVPVLLESSAIASVLRPGDVVDLVAPTASGEPEVIAAGARVLDLPSTGGGLAPTSGGLLVVAVDENDALAVAVSSSRDDLTVVIRAPFAGGDRSQ